MYSRPALVISGHDVVRIPSDGHTRARSYCRSRQAAECHLVPPGGGECKLSEDNTRPYTSLCESDSPTVRSNIGSRADARRLCCSRRHQALTDHTFVRSLFPHPLNISKVRIYVAFHVCSRRVTPTRLLEFNSLISPVLPLYRYRRQRTNPAKLDLCLTTRPHRRPGITVPAHESTYSAFTAMMLPVDIVFDFALATIEKRLDLTQGLNA
jgi:hypothetical protein